VFTCCRSDFWCAPRYPPRWRGRPLLSGGRGRCKARFCGRSCSATIRTRPASTAESISDRPRGRRCSRLQPESSPSRGPSPSAAGRSRFRPRTAIRSPSCISAPWRFGAAPRSRRACRSARLAQAARPSCRCPISIWACGEAASRTATSIRSSSCRGQRLRRARRPRAGRNRLLSFQQRPRRSRPSRRSAPLRQTLRRPLSDVSPTRRRWTSPLLRRVTLPASRQPFMRPPCERLSAGPAAVAVRCRRPIRSGARPSRRAVPGNTRLSRISDDPACRSGRARACKRRPSARFR
jgi:hypothetical protein